jgi:hypothetical protein
LQSKERVEQLLLEVSSKQCELKIGGRCCCKNFWSTNKTKESKRISEYRNLKRSRTPHQFQKIELTLGEEQFGGNFKSERCKYEFLEESVWTGSQMHQQ